MLNRWDFRNAKVDFKELKMVAVCDCMGVRAVTKDNQCRRPVSKNL